MTYPIPERFNLAVATGAMLAAIVCLWVSAHATEWWGAAIAALIFAFVNNTIFSLHHEAVHRTFNSDVRINDAAGVLFAAFFPTIFSVQRISHLGHHRRNRTDLELYDCYLPGQSWLLKSYWLYCLITGFYWAIIPVAGLVYLLWPWTFRARAFQEGPARWWGFEPFIKDIAAAPIKRVWFEGVFSLLFQICLFNVLDLTFGSWLVCYWAFGLNWSSVQYSDHAGSPRDVIEGAWNLKFWPLTQAIFLNYNLHLAHHRRPDVPWIHLPKLVRASDAQPSFWRIYLGLWRGAQKAPEGGAPEPLDHPQTIL